MKLVTLKRKGSDEIHEYVKLTSASDVLKVIKARKEITMREYPQWKKFDTNLAWHCYWRSPVIIALNSLRGLVDSGLADETKVDEDARDSLMYKQDAVLHDLFDDCGHVYITEENLNAFIVDEDEYEEEDLGNILSLPHSDHTYVHPTSLNLVIENDIKLSRAMRTYLENHNVEYSFLGCFRNFVEEHPKKFKNFIREVTRRDYDKSSRRYEFSVYVETSGLNVEQIEETIQYLKRFTVNVYVMTDNVTLYNKIRKKYDRQYDEQSRVKFHLIT